MDGVEFRDPGRWQSRSFHSLTRGVAVLWAGLARQHVRGRCHCVHEGWLRCWMTAVSDPGRDYGAVTETDREFGITGDKARFLVTMGGVSSPMAPIHVAISTTWCSLPTKFDTHHPCARE